MNIRDQPAFPQSRTYLPEHSGMTLRTWLAGQALIGLFAATADPNSRGFTPEEAAKQACLCADALIAELEKTNTKTA